MRAPPGAFGQRARNSRSTIGCANTLARLRSPEVLRATSSTAIASFREAPLLRLERHFELLEDLEDMLKQSFIVLLDDKIVRFLFQGSKVSEVLLEL